MESRKEFLSRMHLLSNEIKQSHLSDDNIFPMIEYQLKEREKEMIRNIKRQVIAKMESTINRKVSSQWIVKKGNDKFLEIIEDL